MLNQPQLDMLRKLSTKPLSVIELAPEVKSSKIDIGKAPGVKLVQRLAKLGYARDYGDQHGRRVEVRLRIWGVTDAGKAALEMQSLADNKAVSGGQSQLSLIMAQKPLPLKARKFNRPITTNQIAEFAKRKKKIEPIPMFEVVKTDDL